MANSISIDKIARDRGFTLFATIQNKGEIEYHYMDSNGINLIVNVQTGCFSFVYGIPKSIFTLNCPTCSPFDDSGHFDKMYHNFRTTVWRFKYL